MKKAIIISVILFFAVQACKEQSTLTKPQNINSSTIIRISFEHGFSLSGNYEIDTLTADSIYIWKKIIDRDSTIIKYVKKKMEQQDWDSLVAKIDTTAFFQLNDYYSVPDSIIYPEDLGDIIINIETTGRKKQIKFYGYVLNLNMVPLLDTITQQIELVIKKYE